MIKRMHILCVRSIHAAKTINEMYLFQYLAEEVSHQKPDTDEKAAAREKNTETVYIRLNRMTSNLTVFWKCLPKAATVGE